MNRWVVQEYGVWKIKYGHVMMMKRLTVPFFILLFLLIPGTAYGQTDITDLSEMFRIFQEARNLPPGFDLAQQQYIKSVPDDYPLGPGDILRIMAGGLVPDMDYFPVDPQGNVLVYPVGSINLEGLTVADAEKVIRDELALYIKDPQVEIQLLQARKIEVYLAGQVMLPGLYITWAGITPIGFLQNASGLVEPPPPGSTIDEGEYLSPLLRILNASASRTIKIYRDEREIGEMDLAATLFKRGGEPDISLEDGDIIYVPQIERPVIVRGGVVRPGKYEFMRTEDLTDVLLMAGGAVSEQFLSEVTIERKTDFGLKKIKVPIDRSYKPIDDEFELRPGDIIRVPETAFYVYVLGGVFLPQAVDYREGWRVIDYIGQAGGIIAPSDYASTSIIKNAGTSDVQKIEVDIKELLKGNPVNDPVVEPGDVIIVPFQNKPWPGALITGTILQFATFARFLWD